MGGHSGAYRTYKHLATNLYWKGIMKSVQNYVAQCLVCHRHKYQFPAGLLHPLPIPAAVWDDISMDFITGLPKFAGYECILVVVD